MHCCGAVLTILLPPDEHFLYMHVYTVVAGYYMPCVCGEGVNGLMRACRCPRFPEATTKKEYSSTCCDLLFVRREDEDEDVHEECTVGSTVECRGFSRRVQ